MKVIIALTMFLSVVGTAARADTAWLAGKAKDEDGKTICIYKAGFEKIYIPADIGDYCDLTADTN